MYGLIPPNFDSVRTHVTIGRHFEAVTGVYSRIVDQYHLLRLLKHITRLLPLRKVYELVDYKSTVNTSRSLSK